MIKTDVKFKTTNKKLSGIYENAMSTLLQSTKSFGGRNVLGYLENDEIIQRCFIFSEEIVYSFSQYIEPNKKSNPKVAEFQEECEKQGFKGFHVEHHNQFAEHDPHFRKSNLARCKLL